ncbi:MAG: protein jag [Solirubrobacteraceae bacterium]
MSAPGLPAEPAERAQAVVERIADALGVAGQVVVEEREDEMVVSIVDEEVGRFIGRHGQVIDAVQHLAYRAAFVDRRGERRVVVDAGGYRERRGVALRGQADRAADDAARTEQAVALPAMSPIERRLVHEYLRDRHDIETYSEGEEPDRHLVVAPVLG